MKATTEYDKDENTFTILTPSHAFNPEVMCVDLQGALDVLAGLTKLVNKHTDTRVTLNIHNP